MHVSRSTVLRLAVPVALALLLAPPAHGARRKLMNSIGSGGAAFIYPAEFQAYTDTLYARGFRSVRLNGQWGQKCYQCAPNVIEFDAEPSPGVFDFSPYFDRLDYAITVKGMKASISFNLAGQLDTDPLTGGSQTVLPGYFGVSDLMMVRNAAGQDLTFHSGPIKCPRFEKPAVRSAMLAFVSAVVTQFRGRYGDAIEYYSFSFSPAAENEYPLAPYPEITDTSPDAAAAFRAWLSQNYSTPAAVAAAWGRVPAFTTFDEIQILDGLPPPQVGSAPQAYLDFCAYREAALAGFLGEIRDCVHGAGGRFMAQYGSTWDSGSAVRGTYGFGAQVVGADLVVIDDAPEYDHLFSMDYVRTNSPGVPFGNEADAPCRFGCSLGYGLCCIATTFPANIDVPAGTVQMNQQIDQTWARGATFLDFGNWDNFYTVAFGTFAGPIANAVAQALVPVTTVVTTDTLEVSLRELYVHHHDQAYLDGLIAAHHALGGLLQPVAVRLSYDLAPAPVVGVAPQTARAGLQLASPAPNPARGGASLQFALPAPSRVRLAVFDLLGRIMLERDLGARGAGTHRTTLATAAWPAGVYVVRIESAGHTIARVFEVLR